MRQNKYNTLSPTPAEAARKADQQKSDEVVQVSYEFEGDDALRNLLSEYQGCIGFDTRLGITRGRVFSDVYCSPDFSLWKNDESDAFWETIRLEPARSISFGV